MMTVMEALAAELKAADDDVRSAKWAACEAFAAWLDDVPDRAVLMDMLLGHGDFGELLALVRRIGTVELWHREVTQKFLAHVARTKGADDDRT